MSIGARLARLEGAGQPQDALAINREVFRLAAAEAAAEWTARLGALADAGLTEEDVSLMLVEEEESDPAAFAAAWEEMRARDEAEHGVAIRIEGCGCIGERDYARLRATVTGRQGGAP